MSGDYILSVQICWSGTMTPNESFELEDMLLSECWALQTNRNVITFMMNSDLTDSETSAMMNKIIALLKRFKYITDYEVSASEYSSTDYSFYHSSEDPEHLMI